MYFLPADASFGLLASRPALYCFFRGRGLDHHTVECSGGNQISVCHMQVMDRPARLNGSPCSSIVQAFEDAFGVCSKGEDASVVRIKLDRSDAGQREIGDSLPGISAVLAAKRAFMRGEPDGATAIDHDGVDGARGLWRTQHEPALSFVRGDHNSLMAGGNDHAAISIEADQVRHGSRAVPGTSEVRTDQQTGGSSGVPLAGRKLQSVDGRRQLRNARSGRSERL